MKKKKRILIITQMYPSGLTGTSVKTRNTIFFLQKKGFLIDVCCFHHSSMIKNEFELDGVRIFYVEKDTFSRVSVQFFLRVFSVILSPLPFRVKKTFDKRLSAMIQILLHSQNYDYVFFDGFSTLQYLQSYSKKYIYVDDEDISDLMWRRFLETSNILLKAFFLLEFWKCKQYEKKYLDFVQQIWAISENSARNLSKSTVRKIFLMPTLIEQHKSIFNKRARHVVFTGLLSWLENIHAIEWFLENSWKEIHNNFPTTKFLVVGQKATPEFVRYLKSFKGVQHLGYVEKLEDVYKNSALAIAPLLINCGIKIKVVTYLSYGLPVVALPESVWGMESSEGVIIAEKNNFTQAVIQLLTDQKKRYNLSRKALKNIAENHSNTTLERFFKKVGVL